MSNHLDDFIANESFWNQVQGFSATSFSTYGRGAVLLHEETSHQESSNRANIAVSYLPETDSSPLWTHETMPFVQNYNPNTEFLVISVQANGEALSLIMDKATPSP